jgi:hypothetical protein
MHSENALLLWVFLSAEVFVTLCKISMPDMRFVFCRKPRHMRRRMASSSWKHLLKLQPMWMTYFMRLVSWLSYCLLGGWFLEICAQLIGLLHPLSCSTIHNCFAAPFLHRHYLFFPLVTEAMIDANIVSIQLQQRDCFKGRRLRTRRQGWFSPRDPTREWLARLHAAPEE